MEGINKQTVGFRFGKFRTTVLRVCGELDADGRKYKLVSIALENGSIYYAIRLYNSDRKFIKQFLFEPWILNGLIDLLVAESNH